ncbi:HlyD family efflux transporter periplasmic adaptor subunit [Anabaena subtropica]|nr:HlyD family efflux transporter periplasmic adaptor subunit [Anabaena subtropica]
MLINLSTSVTSVNRVNGNASASVKFISKKTDNLQDRKLEDKLKNNQTVQLSTSLQTFLEQSPSFPFYQMILGGIAFCITIATWANFAHIDEVGKATGRLVPQGDAYKIHPVISGKMAYIRVREGEFVKAGQVIAQLDKEIVLNEVEKLTRERTTYQTQLFKTQTLIEKSRWELKQHLERNNAEIEAQNSTKTPSQKVAIAQGQKSDSISQSQLLQLQADTLAQSDRLLRFQSLIEQELQTEKTIQKLQTEKTQLQAKVQQVEKQLQEAKARLRQLTLISPIDGVVLSLNVGNSGEVIQPGQTIAEIAPQNTPLILEAILPIKEAGFVEVGNTAQIKFNTYPYEDYGIVSGRVISVAPRSKLDERLGTAYQVKIAPERNYVKANDQNTKFKAGQTAKTEIVIRRRSIADILLDQIKQLPIGSKSV